MAPVPAACSRVAWSTAASPAPRRLLLVCDHATRVVTFAGDTLLADETWASSSNAPNHAGWGQLEGFDVVVGDDRVAPSTQYAFVGPVLAAMLCAGLLAWVYHRTMGRTRAAAHSRVGAQALCEHASIPTSAKVAVPVLLCLTLGLFAFSNAVVGANVRFQAFVFEHKVLEFDLFEFSLINTVRDMWHAKVYPLSVLVGIWSGIWPYLKLFLMGVAWFTPPHALKPDHRRRLLIAMDMLGKWALIDLFLMLMMTIAFRFHITTATILPVFKQLLTVDIMVLSETGLFTFVTAVALSLVCNHIILAFHRNVVSIDDVEDGVHRGYERRRNMLLSPLLLLASPVGETGAPGNEASHEEPFPRTTCFYCPKGSWFDSGTVEALESDNSHAVHLAVRQLPLYRYRFSTGVLAPVLIDHKTKRLRTSIVLFSLCLALSILILTLAAATVDTFEFVFKGLAGNLIHAVDEPQTVRKSSLLSIASELGKLKQEQGSPVEVLYLQGLYLIFSFVVPVFVLAQSVAMLLAPFTLRQAKIFFYSMEVLTAWAALDVFIVSIIAAVLQIDQFSHFLEGPMCDPIKKSLHVGECFGVDTKLLPGCWLIVLASACLWCYLQFVQRVGERYLTDREERILKLLNSDLAASTNANNGVVGSYNAGLVAVA